MSAKKRSAPSGGVKSLAEYGHRINLLADLAGLKNEGLGGEAEIVQQSLASGLKFDERHPSRQSHISKSNNSTAKCSRAFGQMWAEQTTVAARLARVDGEH